MSAVLFLLSGVGAASAVYHAVALCVLVARRSRRLRRQGSGDAGPASVSGAGLGGEGR